VSAASGFLTLALVGITCYYAHLTRRIAKAAEESQRHVVEMARSEGLLYVFVVLGLERRRLLHVHVTAHPTAAWTAQQMIEALPEGTGFSYVIRDRDAIYGMEFQRRVAGMGLVEVSIALRSPWHNCYAERFVGSLRRECLDHVIAVNERQVRRIVSNYARYYNRARTHLALPKDAPEPRRVQSRANGRVVAFPEVGGLHHHYERVAA